MRKYGKWVLTLSLLAATPGLAFSADSKSKDASASTGSRASRVDNQRVAEDIANALRGKVKGEISIEYKDGVATLSGSVADPKIKKTASSLVEQVDNVTRVDNRLTIVERKRAMSERLRNKPADEVVQAGHESDRGHRNSVQQVNAELPVSAGPGSRGPVYASALGNAGVPSQGTPNPPSQNQEVAEQIGAALSEARLDGYDIQIRFQNGVATLDGSVGNQTERATATRVVSSISGVRNVSNRLSCTEEPAPQYANPAARGAGPGPYGYPQQAHVDVRGAGYMQPGAGQGQGYPGNSMPMAPGAPPYPPAYGNQGGASQAVYNSPNMPDHSWPSYAQYPNSAAVTYPQQYSASAWPYIGPFYPYPQVPLGWRDATLRWDDGQWNLMFRPRTDRWWWFMNPNNW